MILIVVLQVVVMEQTVLQRRRLSCSHSVVGRAGQLVIVTSVINSSCCGTMVVSVEMPCSGAPALLGR
jgi:hypothetical protein